MSAPDRSAKNHMQKAGYINGEFVAGDSAELCVENPSDGSEVARFAGLSQEQVTASIDAARQAFDGGCWSERSVHERAKVLHRLIATMEARADARLSGYVYGSDADEVLAVARRIHSGAVHVNGALSSTFVPFGGIKASGLGHERGVEGLRMYQRLKIFSVAGQSAS